MDRCIDLYSKCIHFHLECICIQNNYQRSASEYIQKIANVERQTKKKPEANKEYFPDSPIVRMSVAAINRLALGASGCQTFGNAPMDL